MQKICNHDQVQKEELTKRTLLANGYPENFVKQDRRQTKTIEKTGHRRKEVNFMSVPFKDDHLSNQINRNPKSVIRHAYLAAELRQLQTLKRLRLQNHSNCLAGPNISQVSQFTCSCSNAYIRKRDRCLTQRVSELTEMFAKVDDAILWDLEH